MLRVHSLADNLNQEKEVSEKWFVCSESEFTEALNSAVAATMVAYRIVEGGPEVLERSEKAEAACRARPFEKYQAVVEAARELEMCIGSSMSGKGSYRSEQDAFMKLGRALAALEEDV